MSLKRKLELYELGYTEKMVDNAGQTKFAKNYHKDQHRDWNSKMSDDAFDDNVITVRKGPDKFISNSYVFGLEKSSLSE